MCVLSLYIVYVSGMLRPGECVAGGVEIVYSFNMKKMGGVLTPFIYKKLAKVIIFKKPHSISNCKQLYVHQFKHVY